MQENKQTKEQTNKQTNKQANEKTNNFASPLNLTLSETYFNRTTKFNHDELGDDTLYI